MPPLTTSEFTVKSYFDFAEEVINYNHNIYAAGLDVESLVTNTVYSQKRYSGKLTRKCLFDLLKLATTESSFILKNNLHRQINGIVMG